MEISGTNNPSTPASTARYYPDFVCGSPTDFLSFYIFMDMLVAAIPEMEHHVPK